MRNISILMILTGLALGSTNAQVYTSSESTSFKNDSLFKKVEIASIGNYSIDAWANQASNTITAGFMNSIAQGGFISRDEIDPIMDSHTGNKGYLGGSAGFNVSWAVPAKEGKMWSLCGSFGSETIVDTRWTKDLFELVWYGNASSVGETNILSGTGARVGVFNRFSLGGVKNDTKQRIELSLVQRLAGAEWSLPYGYVYVSENGDSLETYLQSEARIHYGENSTFKPSYGIALSGTVPIRSDDIPVEVDINFKDVGLLFESQGSNVYWIQDGFSTTGLPVLGDSLTWESIVNGDVSTDSIVQSGESVSRMALLPAKLGASVKYKSNEKLSFLGSVVAGGWMPEAMYSGGVSWNYSDDITVGLNYKKGGWGDGRFEFWARLNVPGERNLYISLEEPLGLMFQDESAAATTCRGITLRLSKDNE